LKIAMSPGAGVARPRHIPAAFSQASVVGT